VKMPSNSVHRFSEVPMVNVPRSVFDRTHSYKTTFDAGYLIPFYVDEALPGDTFNMNATVFARLATPIVPVMDNLFLDTFYFAVPLRLLWNNFQKFCGEQVDPDDSTDYETPYVESQEGSFTCAVGSLYDYFGLPTGVTLAVDSCPIVNFHGRAYNLIWNEWFRDQNLQDSVVVDKDDGPDASADYVLLRRGKRHDYFTSCLPWPQKGPGVELPLGDTAPVIGIGKADADYNDVDQTARETDGTGAVTYASSERISEDAAYRIFRVEEDPNNAGFPNIRADLSAATASTINSLRQAFQIQRLYERDARGGTRYTEILKSHFGVTSPDARLQRPEFLGGNSSPVIISPVPQNAPANTETPTPQGNLAAIGTAVAGREGFSKSFTEHSVIIGLCMVRADLTYQQGVNRMFSRRSRWDYYWPALAHLGEQAVVRREIFAGDGDNDLAVFGYQERWAEYRYFPSKITGKLRSTYAQTLDVWHLSQEFASAPTLSATFIVENPPMDRIIAVTNEPHFIMDSFIKLRCVRPMPVYSVPGLIDHF